MTRMARTGGDADHRQRVGLVHRGGCDRGRSRCSHDDEGGRGPESTVRHGAARDDDEVATVLGWWKFWENAGRAGKLAFRQQVELLWAALGA